MISSNLEKILVPYCKFQNGYPPKWGYIDTSNGSIYTGLYYGYCSLFRNNYAILGEYHHYSKDRNLVFGVINKKMESVENPIYSYLEFYPRTSNCFIGTLNTKNRFEDNNFNKVFFNVENGFIILGREIIPINEKILTVNDGLFIKIITIEGKLLSKQPFYIDSNGNPTEFHKDSYSFKEITDFENGFCLDYFKTEITYYQDEDPLYELDTYNEQHFYFDYNLQGELLYKGPKHNSRDRLVYNDLCWNSNDIKEMNFLEVLYELVEQKLIDSDKIYHPVFYGAKLYQHKSGQKYWEPKFEDFKTIKKL